MYEQGKKTQPIHYQLSCTRQRYSAGGHPHATCNFEANSCDINYTLPVYIHIQFGLAILRLRSIKMIQGR